MMVAAGAAASTTPNLKPTAPARARSNPRARPPLLPSESENNNVAFHRRSKSREVTSRYLSSSLSSTSASSNSTSSNSSCFSSRRCPSPIPSRAAATVPNSGSIKRSQSVERRRPGTPRPNVGGIGVEMSAAAKLLASSTKSLSVSFQGDSFSMPVSKTKPSPSPNMRRSTPERRRDLSASRTMKKDVDQGENTRTIEHQRWPGRSRGVMNSLSRSVDLGSSVKKLIANGSSKVVRALQQSLMDEGKRKSSGDENLEKGLSGSEPEIGVNDAVDVRFDGKSSLASESMGSELESVSSEYNSGAQGNGNLGGVTRGGRGATVPAKFWQETSNRSRHGSDPIGSPLSRSNSVKGTVPSKLVGARKVVSDSPMSSPRGTMINRGFSSPIRGAVRPASPSKLGTSLASEKSSQLRGMASPSRARNAISGAFGNNVSSTPSLLSFVADVRRGKIGESKVGDAQLLRLLYNRHLQWRFVNARAESSLYIQKLNAENCLYSAWKTTLDLRTMVSAKRKELQWLRQKLKLMSILKGQISHLEEWALVEKDHSLSLSGAIEALKASTIRLPVVDGVRVDMHNVKDAIWSAGNVIQTMASSICSVLLKVEDVNSLVGEVANLASKERFLLSECKDILSALAAMQVKDCSLRAHVLQLKLAPSTLAVEV